MLSAQYLLDSYQTLYCNWHCKVDTHYPFSGHDQGQDQSIELYTQWLINFCVKVTKLDSGLSY